jgi:rhamnosyltransferase
MSFPNVSVIMPTHQGGGQLARTLQALRAQRYDGMVEFVAVDSGSTDGTCALLREYGATLLSIRREHFSHGYVRNLGVQCAQFPIVVFLSQDAVPVGTDWLRTLVAPLQDGAFAATYARQMARSDATSLERFFHLQCYPDRSSVYRITTDGPTPLDAIFFSNVCSAAQREFCLAFPFDETLIMSEDQAFAKALLAAGYQTYYNAAAMVTHSHHYDIKTLLRRNFDSAYSLRTIADDTFPHVAGKGIRYVLEELRYLLSQRAWRWLMYAPIYEFTRSLGWVLGRYAERLPDRLCKRLSLRPGYWDLRTSANGIK